jgi:DNA repair protein RecN (Recombination protein N)
MLERLVIKNYLLLKDINIAFSEGFNVFTGETGAGKSILINALNLLFGERADYSIISKGNDKMLIEAVLKISKNKSKRIEKFLTENQFELLPENILIIRRELFTKAYSRFFINDSPAAAAQIKELSSMIIDIHSQNEHQSLLKKEEHLSILDEYIKRKTDSKYSRILDDYKNKYNELKSLVKEYEDLISKKNNLEQNKSFLEFQLKEITDVNPSQNEDIELEQELKKYENSETIKSVLENIYYNLYEGNGSVLEKIKIIEKELTKIAEYSNEVKSIIAEIIESGAVLNEASRAINEIKTNLHFDPQLTEECRNRLYKLQFLKKKYGGKLEEVIRHKEKIQEELNITENFDNAIENFNNKINNLKDELFINAEQISKIRSEKAKIFEKETIKLFKELDLDNAEFKVEINSPPSEQIKNKQYQILNPFGFNETEFLVKVNKGDEYSPLRKTASGGEVSRIMLAIKSALAGSDQAQVLIFDEIDTGISGKTAQKTGIVMKNLSRYSQLIAVTHLPQIASLAQTHFLVEKKSDSNKTITSIRKLKDSEKIIEVAKLLSGQNVTDSSIKQAKELMNLK